MLSNLINVRSLVIKKRTMHMICRAPLLENPYSLFLLTKTDIWSNQIPDGDGDDTLYDADADGDGDDDADDDDDGRRSGCDASLDVEPVGDGMHADGDDDSVGVHGIAGGDALSEDDDDMIGSSCGVSPDIEVVGMGVQGDDDDDDEGCSPVSVSLTGTASRTHVL